MASFDLLWRQSAVRELRKLPAQTIPKIISAVESLRENPRPNGSKKLTNAENSYRIRVGDYRIIYLIVADQLIIEVIKVGHRREVYR